MTNSDKIFKSVIGEQALINYGDYNPEDYDSINDSINDDNIVIATVARIILYQSKNHSEKEIYNEVTNYLKDNIL